MKSFMNFLRDERGAVGAEYALVVAAGAATVYGSAKGLSDVTNSKFDGVADTLSAIDTEPGDGGVGG